MTSAATAEPVKQPQPAPPTPRPYRWTVAGFHRLAEAGVLGEDDRIELIEGELIEMAPIGSDHAGHTNRLTHQLISLLGEKAVVAVQNPVVLDEVTEPQPDIALLRWRDDFYTRSHPTAADVLLLIEVADSTVRYDRETKIPLYARHGISEVWIIDLQQQRLEAYHKPGDGEYSEITYHRTGSIAPRLLPDAAIALDRLLPA